MDGMGSKKNVFIIGATNRPDIIDPAILRYDLHTRLHLNDDKREALCQIFLKEIFGRDDNNFDR